MTKQKPKKAPQDAHGKNEHYSIQFTYQTSNITPYTVTTHSVTIFPSQALPAEQPPVSTAAQVEHFWAVTLALMQGWDSSWQAGRLPYPACSSSAASLPAREPSSRKAKSGLGWHSWGITAAVTTTGRVSHLAFAASCLKQISQVF